jgi:hypothetical protein
MNKILFILVLVISFFCTLPAFATANIGDLQFATNYDTLVAQAVQSQRVIILKFFTDW